MPGCRKSFPSFRLSTPHLLRPLRPSIDMEEWWAQKKQADHRAALVISGLAWWQLCVCRSLLLYEHHLRSSGSPRFMTRLACSTTTGGNWPWKTDAGESHLEKNLRRSRSTRRHRPPRGALDAPGDEVESS